MSSVQGTPQFRSLSQRYSFWPVVLVGLVLPLLLYGLLPLLGLGKVSETFSVIRVVLLMVAVLGFTAYWYYWDALKNKPHILLLGLLATMPWIGWLNMLTRDAGINIYVTVWLAILVCLPTCHYGLQYRHLLWHRIPYLRVFLFFTSLVLLYYVFFNHHVEDPRTNAGKLTLGYHYMYNIVFQCLMVILGAVSIYSQTQPEKLFGKINRIMAFLIGAYGLTTIVTYPFGLLTLEDSGINRAKFIFTHANQLSHYMGIGVLYLLGLYFYQSFTQHKTIRQPILMTTIILGFLGFMMSFSKTAIAAFCLSAFFLIVFNLATWKTLLRLLKVTLALPLILLVSLYGFIMATGNNPLESLLTRIDQTSSIDWRYRVWDYLLFEVTPLSTLIGHGLSGVSERMLLFEGFNEDKVFQGGYVRIVNAHNAYLTCFYDFGLPGLLLFATMMATCVQTLISVVKTPPELPSRALGIMWISMVLYFLISCASDTTFEILELPFWLLISVIFAYRDRVQHQWISD